MTLFSAILDHRGRLQHVMFGRPHGNTKYQFSFEAERMVDAEQIAASRAPEEWARLSAAKPPAAPRPPRLRGPRVRREKALECRCGLPVAARGEICDLCREQQFQNACKRAALEPRVAKPEDPVLIALLEVQREWTQSTNVGLFTKWLSGRIAQLRAK